jgi:hypothetical protein
LIHFQVFLSICEEMSKGKEIMEFWGVGGMERRVKEDY